MCNKVFVAGIEKFINICGFCKGFCRYFLKSQSSKELINEMQVIKLALFSKDSKIIPIG